ncbi:MAG: type II and III secretion system protein family protein [Proteobacteria bacterium]|nr:type II and III secretion system protein family protein [Pseudomonadota bacterium]MBU1612157.1 type II and III secretion system protein family protein [Pseudomonadota bacterium]
MLLLLAALSALALFALFLEPAMADSTTPTGVTISQAEVLQLHTRKSLVLDTESDVTRVSLASPENADILLISPRQIYLTGKTPGSTTLTLWGPGDKVMRVYNIVISPDLMLLKQMIHTVLPQESGIQVLSTGDMISLSGMVSSTTNLSTALSLAEAAAPERVMNLMQVGGVQQVMLEVRIAEMSRSVTKRMGFNLNYVTNGLSFYTFLNNLTGMAALGEAVGISDNVNAVFQSTRGSASVTGFLDALKANGLVKILAEPNLICLSGETANFLAGGEIPVPVPSGLGTIAIEYKPFGVWLEFTPTVLSPDKINLVVRPEVSELDYDQGVNIESIVVPAVTTRRTETTIELADGQSFAVAGLIKDNLRENAYKIPGLGELPIIGTLFRSSEYLKEQTELVIIVTPHLVKPVDMAQQTLPTDNIKEPSDFEFYLMGSIEGEGSGPAAMARPREVTPPPSDDSAGFDGDFGHVMPN